MESGTSYLAWSPLQANNAVYLASLDSNDRTKLLVAQSKAVYANSGYLLFHRQGILFAQPFDVRGASLTGEPLRVADEVSYDALDRSTRRSTCRTTDVSSILRVMDRPSIGSSSGTTEPADGLAMQPHPASTRRISISPGTERRSPSDSEIVRAPSTTSGCLIGLATSRGG